MGWMLVGFSTDKKDWISSIIRFFTWSKFSHVVLISPDFETYIESTHGVGVREMSIRNLFEKDAVEVARIYHSHPCEIWELVKKEIGKPYDDKYIYGWLFHRDWQDDKKWACCELIPAMAARTGVPIIRKECFNKVTPETLYMISERIF